MAQHVNPYVAGRPIDAPEGFYGREDVFGIVRDAVFGGIATNCLALFGGRRTGKTSVLKQLERGRLGKEVVACLVNMEELGNASDAEFLSRVAAEIAAKLGMDASAVCEGPAANAIPEFSTFLNKAMEPLGDRRLLIMIDETEKLRDLVTRQSMSEDLLDYLSHLNEDRNNVVLLYTGSYALRIAQDPLLARLLARTTFHEISFLDRQTATRLACEPAQGVLQYSPDALEELWRLAAGHPFFIQILCRMVFQTVTAEGRGLCGREDVVAAAAHVVANEPPHLHYVWQSELEAKERLVAAALADLRPGRGITIGPRDAAGRLRKGRAPLPISLVDAAVSNLAFKKLVRRQGGSIAFALGLYEDWLLQRHPLSATTHEERESLREILPFRSRPWRVPVAVASMVALVALAYALVVPGLAARHGGPDTDTDDNGHPSNSVPAAPPSDQAISPQQPRPAPEAGDESPEYTQHRFDDLGFAIAVPAEWVAEKRPISKTGESMVLFMPDEPESRLRIKVETACGGPKYAETAARKQDAKLLNDYGKDRYDPTDIAPIGVRGADPKNGQLWEFKLDLAPPAEDKPEHTGNSADAGKGDRVLRKMVLYCNRKDRGYNILCQAPAQQYNQYRLAFEHAIRRLELLPVTPAATARDTAPPVPMAKRTSEIESAASPVAPRPPVPHPSEPPSATFQTYRCSELGWSMDLPDRWVHTVERGTRDDGDAITQLRTFRPTGGSEHALIRVEATPGNQGDPARVYKQISQGMPPGCYHQIDSGTHPMAVDGQSRPSYRWEFTLKPEEGPLLHRVIVYCHQDSIGYGVVFQAPDSAWAQYVDAFEEVLASLTLFPPRAAGG